MFTFEPTKPALIVSVLTFESGGKMISEVDWVRENVLPSPTAAGSLEISPINWVNLKKSNQSTIKQSSNQVIKQSIKQSSNQAIKQSSNQESNQAIKQLSN